MTFSYTNNVPNPPNNPSVDVTPMQQNTNSISGIIAVDHIGFNVANGGWHNIIHLTPQVSDPAVSAAGQLYAKTLAGTTELYYETPAGIISKLTQLSSNVSNGFILFPGGLIIQWGSFNPNSSLNVSFPITFPNNVFNVQLTGSASNNSTFRAAVSTGTLTTSGFTFQGTVDIHWNPIYFLAIGF